MLVSKGLIIPQNTQLLGHALGAAAIQGQAPSWISVIVDRAEWKEPTVALHAFLFGQIHASPGPQTGKPTPLYLIAEIQPQGRNNGLVENRHNLADPRSAIAISRDQNEATWDQERIGHPASFSDVRSLVTRGVRRFLFCEKHNLKLSSGVAGHAAERAPKHGPAHQPGSPAEEPRPATR